MTETETWRYEIQYGPEGEANYAWVYRGKEMVATMRTHHAVAVVAAMSSTRASVSEAAIEPNAMRFFSENVDGWGAAEWFDRLAKAIREQDNAVVAKDDIGFEIYRMIAASSAMTLVRDHECTVRAALSAALASTAETVEPVAWREILAERIRQVEAEGWTPEHDDQHTDNELPRAAACYCIGNIGYWPWDLDWWKPTDRRRNLIKAAALILAEIERIDRSAKGGSHESI